MAATTILEPAEGQQQRVARDAGHVGALDGLRGIAVAVVVVFHAAPASWLRGGFLGVSLFFTLSGYLITSLALREVAASGTFSVREFYARRVRRLVPALMVVIIAVVTLANVVDLVGRTRWQVIGGLTYLSNWVQIFSDTTYAELWSGPGVLDHLWSLAIEEQWYIVFPLLVAALVRVGGVERLRRRLGWMFGGVVALSVVGALVSSDDNFVYLGTHTRLGEIAIGGLLALLVPLGSARVAPGASHVGQLALGAVLVLCGVTTINSSWLYVGLLPVFALLSALVINGAVRPGKLAERLSWAPLRRLGLISYGLYLYHWPIAVLFAPPRVTWPPVVLFAVRVTLSLAAAEISYRLIEMPLRTRQFRALPTITGGVTTLATATFACVSLAVIPTRALTAAASPTVRVIGGASPSGAAQPGAAPQSGVAAGALSANRPSVDAPSADDRQVANGDPVVAAVATPPVVETADGNGSPSGADAAAPPFRPGASIDTGGSLTTAPVGAEPTPGAATSPQTESAPGSPGTPSTPGTAPVDPAAGVTSGAPMNVVMFGDSIADWLLRDAESVVPRNWSLVDAAIEGCDGARGMPSGRSANGAALPVPDVCPSWDEWYPEAIAAFGDGTDKPVAVLMPGQAVVVDRASKGSWAGPCSEEIAAWYVGDIEGRLKLLDGLASRVVVVLPAWVTDQSIWIYPADHVERVTCVRAMIRRAVTGHEGVSLVDLADLVCPYGPGRCRDLRVADGVHFDPTAAPGVLSWLLARINGDTQASIAPS